MALLSAHDLEVIKKDVSDIVKDTSINTTIKYRQLTSGVTITNVTTQTFANPFTNWSGVSAIKGTVTKNDLNLGNDVQVGQAKFVIMQSSVSNALSISDVLVESGSTYIITKITYDPLGIVYQLYCENC